jgi:hypothetical protein
MFNSIPQLLLVLANYNVWCSVTPVALAALGKHGECGLPRPRPLDLCQTQARLGARRQEGSRPTLL